MTTRNLSLRHNPAPSDELFGQAADILKLLGEPTRLRLLWLLSDKEHTVGELVEATGAPRTVVSQHLAKLRLGNLVSSRRNGRNIIYHISDGHLKRMVAEAVNRADHMVSGEPLHD
ncbi:ArsR/SmtB family transcription factor [Corynebacterium mendelii]|uniref:Winged helix-turn-helix transcriptional regulator n=1 Tax=Corynebacterium mendelii TaxID=2765362 RepID=A0A939E0L2_9CORY|nr:metalloregulator ArsR/SmtB family transcription factor [Corynebacterium mendelii]MBN9644250.1 winged helix-turn-helix transcriptional regulator [Corynebacterium mendelii]